MVRRPRLCARRLQGCGSGMHKNLRRCERRSTSCGIEHGVGKGQNEVIYSKQ